MKLKEPPDHLVRRFAAAIFDVFNACRSIVVSAATAKQNRRSGAQIDLSKAVVRSLPPLTAIGRSGTGRSRDRESVSQHVGIEFEAAIADLANPNSDADLLVNLARTGRNS